MAEQVPPRRARLGARLREVRARNFRSGLAFANAIDGWAQSKVSKLERGAQLPSDQDLDTWIAVAGGTEADRAELDVLRTAARLSYRTWTDKWGTGRGAVEVEEEIAALERAATRIDEYQPRMIPGLAQTPAYARAVLSTPAGPVLTGADPRKIEAKVTARAERQQQVLYAPDKRIRLLVEEAALRNVFGDPSILAGQLDRLAVLADLESVELGVLTDDDPSPLMPLTDFSVIDDKAVSVESTTGDQLLQDPDEVQVFVRKFQISWDTAATGSAAVDLFRRSRP